ncbi:MAG: DUF86 domain-containing protein [Deltaproteobacteria bacterium]|nr:DUF86 domain-containing protein [Deltaproteobacteria bacterium]
MREDGELLLDILDAIEKYALSGKEAFIEDELHQVWIVYHIQVIGEAASHVSKSLRNKHPDVSWPDIVGMRNVLVHQYFGIDLEQIWDTVQIDLPILKAETRAILDELS